MTDAEARDPRLAATRALARAWNRLDPGEVAPFLREDVRYESFDTELELLGKRQVLSYLERKTELIAAAGESARVHAEMGRLPGPADPERPCVISRQGGRRRAALFVLSVDDAGLISRVQVVTSDPDPAEAVGSGIYPG